MGLLKKSAPFVPPHPRKMPRVPGPLTPEGMEKAFVHCADFRIRRLSPWGGGDGRTVTLCYLEGMVRTERVCDYVLRPMARDPALREGDMRGIYDRLLDGALYDLSVQPREDLDSAAADLIGGCCVLFFPGVDRALSCSAGTEEKRSVSDPENEPVVKGARDAFVESLRTNTSLVRRRLRAPELKIREHTVGRQTLTPVDVLWLEGIAAPDTVKEVERRLDAMDVDGLLAAGTLEEYLTDEVRTPFPLLAGTERPDRFADGLVEGRVGVLLDGIPLGYLLPGTVSQFLRSGQDKNSNWLAATALLILRGLCLLVTLFLPAVYVAAVTFHPGMLPTRLFVSIVAAKQEVPFSAIAEALVMLAAFEVLQEAGLRLPAAMGQTVSILGGLVVGSAAVEAKIVSPAVLIIVAIAGITGYTMPSQDFAAALRIWRFLLTVLGGLAGLFGVVMGAVVLTVHLAQLESFGVAYLSPFAANAGERTEDTPLIRLPVPWDKLRPAALRTPNRRARG